MSPVSLRRNNSRDHVIVCGDGRMVQRLVEELTVRHDVDVVVVLRSRRHNRGPHIAKLAGVRIVESDQVDVDSLESANIGAARALALMDQDDVGNIHVALRARAAGHRLRLVVRMFNTRLGDRIRPLLGDCAMVSDASMAAPSFVSAALRELAPGYLEVGERVLYVTRRRRVPPGADAWPVAALLSNDGNGNEANGDTGALRTMLAGRLTYRRTQTELFSPGGDTPPELVLVAAPRRPRTLLRTSRRRIRRFAGRVWDELREVVDRKLRFITALLLLIMITGIVLISRFHEGGLDWNIASYVSILAAAGGIDPDLGADMWEKVAHVMVAVSGALLIPVFTASIIEAVVGRRLAANEGRLREPISDHVVVVGLGNVGTRVVGRLRRLGVPVVAVERDKDSWGVETARGMGVPVVFGDASRTETLDEAQVRTCRSLVAVTSDDVTNLEAGLTAQSIRPELRVVLRVFDPELADLVQRTFGIAASLSVSRVAAAEFAAAMTDRAIVGTIPVGRKLLLIGQLTVQAGSPLEGAQTADVDTDGSIRLLARTTNSGTEWSPGSAHTLSAGDRLMVMTNRSGLAEMVTLTQPAASA